MGPTRAPHYIYTYEFCLSANFFQLSFISEQNGQKRGTFAAAKLPRNGGARQKTGFKGVENSLLGECKIGFFCYKFATFFLPHVVRVYNMRCSDEGLSRLVRVHGAAKSVLSWGTRRKCRGKVQKMKKNGVANGQANGVANGQANGVANGQAIEKVMANAEWPTTTTTATTTTISTTSSTKESVGDTPMPPACAGTQKVTRFVKPTEQEISDSCRQARMRINGKKMG